MLGSNKILVDRLKIMKKRISMCFCTKLYVKCFASLKRLTTLNRRHRKYGVVYEPVSITNIITFKYNETFY